MLFGLMSSHLFFCFRFSFLRRQIEKKILPMSSSRIFMVSDHAFKSLTHCEFIFISGVRKQSCLTLLHGTVQFSQYYLLKRLFFPILYSCLLGHRLVDHIRSIGLFCVLCSIDVCVCLWSSTILIWLLKLCGVAWNQRVWYLQLCSVSRPFWLFGFFVSFFCVSILISELAVLVLWEMQLVFWEGWHWKHTQKNFCPSVTE